MEIETSTYLGELPSQNGHWTNKLAEGKQHRQIYRPGRSGGQTLPELTGLNIDSSHLPSVH